MMKDVVRGQRTVHRCARKRDVDARGVRRMRAVETLKLSCGHTAERGYTFDAGGLPRPLPLRVKCRECASGSPLQATAPEDFVWTVEVEHGR